MQKVSFLCFCLGDAASLVRGYTSSEWNYAPSSFQMFFYQRFDLLWGRRHAVWLHRNSKVWAIIVASAVKVCFGQRLNLFQHPIRSNLSAEERKRAEDCNPLRCPSLSWQGIYREALSPSHRTSGYTRLSIIPLSLAFYHLLLYLQMKKHGITET